MQTRRRHPARPTRAEVIAALVCGAVGGGVNTVEAADEHFESFYPGRGA